MRLLIDAYNLFKQILKKPHLTEGEIKYFLNLLKKYGLLKKLDLIIVFDGGPFQYLSRERVGAIEILHAGYKQTADDVIKQLLHEYAHQDILLISSDIELKSEAAKVGIESLSSLDFYDKLKHSVRGSQRASPSVQGDDRLYKMTEADNQIVDDLMQLYTTSIPNKKEDMVQTKIADGKTIAKKDKKLNSMLKKL